MKLKKHEYNERKKNQVNPDELLKSELILKTRLKSYKISINKI